MSHTLDPRLRPLIVIASILGICVFRSTLPLKIYSAIVVVMLTTTCFAWYAELDPSKYVTTFESFVLTSMMILMMLTAVSLTLLSIFGSNLDAIILGTSSKPPNWKKYLYPIILRAGLIIFAFFASINFSPFVAEPTIKEQLVFYVSFCQTSILQLQFSSALQIVSDQWEVLTNAINLKPSRVERIARILKEANRLHEISSMVSSAFSKQILISLTRLFILTTLFVYLLANEIELRFPDKEFYVFVHNSVYALALMVAQLIELWSLITSCENINMKSENFNLSLFTLAIEDRVYRICSMECVKNHFAIMRTTVFTAFGFVHLNYPLLCYMAATATTYLVILIQFTPEEGEQGGGGGGEGGGEGGDGGGGGEDEEE